MPITFPERLKEICSQKGIKEPSWVEKSKYGETVVKEYFSSPEAFLLPKKKYAEEGKVMEIMQYPDWFLPKLDSLIAYLIEHRPDKPKRKRKEYVKKPVRSFKPTTQ